MAGLGTNPFFAMPPIGKVEENPFLALEPIRKTIPSKTPKTFNNEPTVVNGIRNPYVQRLDPLPFAPVLTTKVESSSTSSFNIGVSAALPKKKKVPAALKTKAMKRSIHFGGDEEFDDGTVEPLDNAALLNGYETLPKNNLGAKEEDSIIADPEEEEEDMESNPLFKAAGLVEARKRIKAVLETRRVRRNGNTIEMDDEEEAIPSPGSSWRFSGSILDDEEDLQGDGAMKRRELKLDTPPYMFFNPENRNQNKRQKGMVASLGKMPEIIQASPDLKKYWNGRYQLFSKYDEGIKLDRESWFSVTPENIAIHIADRCSTDGIIIDAFCGCGGNTIQFARRSERVIAIDIDPVKIANARHNARIYGVEHKITFVVADFMTLAPALKADVVFLSPPWGGPQYGKVSTFDLKTMIPMDGLKLYNLAKEISPNIAYYVPRNVDRNQLALLCGAGGAVEIESNISGGHIKALTAYYGELIQNN